MSSMVNHPKHYNTGKIEVIEYIEDQKFGYHLGNAIKYISRAGKKGSDASTEKLDRQKETEDLKKAIWYIERHIEQAKENPRRPNDMNVPTDVPLSRLSEGQKRELVGNPELYRPSLHSSPEIEDQRNPMPRRSDELIHPNRYEKGPRE